MIRTTRNGLVTCAILVGGLALLPQAAVAGPCDPPANEIACENSKAGTPPSEWDVNGAGNPTIQGFSTQISVDPPPGSPGVCFLVSDWIAALGANR